MPLGVIFGAVIGDVNYVFVAVGTYPGKELIVGIVVDGNNPRPFHVGSRTRRITHDDIAVGALFPVIKCSRSNRKDWWFGTARPHHELFIFSLAGIEAVIVSRIGGDPESLLSNSFQAWNRLCFVRDQRGRGARWRSGSAVGPAGHKLDVHRLAQRRIHIWIKHETGVTDRDYPVGP